MSEYHPENEKTTDSLKKKLRRYQIITGVYTLGLLVFAGYYITAHASSPVYEVLINGKPVAAGANEKAIQSLLETIKHDKSNGMSNVSEFVQHVEIKHSLFSRMHPQSIDTLKPILEKKLTLKAKAACIIVNDEPVVAVTRRDDAEAALDKFKARFTENKKLASEPHFKEKVWIENAVVDPAGMCENVDEAVDALIGGGESTSIHKVKDGENAWTISKKYGILPDDLAKLNPGKNIEHLYAGDELKIGQSKPLITVVTTEHRKISQEIPYHTQRRENPSVFQGKEFVIQHGHPGRRQIELQVSCENGVVVQHETERNLILSHSQDQITVVGTKKRNAENNHHSRRR